MWEDFEALRQHFPTVPAWGQAGAYGGGDVRAACSQSAQVGKEDDQEVGRHVGSRQRQVGPNGFVASVCERRERERYQIPCNRKHIPT